MRQTVVLCDLHDGPETATSSFRVLVDGTARRLDVCAEHATWLADLPAFAGDEAADVELSAPQVSPAGLYGGPHTRAGSRRSLRAERAAARDWARLQGAEVADRGRLPTGLLERYREQAG